MTISSNAFQNFPSNTDPGEIFTVLLKRIPLIADDIKENKTEGLSQHLLFLKELMNYKNEEKSNIGDVESTTLLTSKNIAEGILLSLKGFTAKKLNAASPEDVEKAFKLYETSTEIKDLDTAKELFTNFAGNILHGKGDANSARQMSLSDTVDPMLGSWATGLELLYSYTKV